MADFTVTDASVKVTFGDNTQSSRLIIVGKISETVTPFMPLYLDTSVVPNVWKKAIGTTAVLANVAGLSLCSGTADQYIAILKKPNEGEVLPEIDGLSEDNPGVEIYLSALNAGKTAPRADLAPGDFVTRLGIVGASGLLRWQPDPSGVGIP